MRTEAVAVITGGCGGMGLASARRLGKGHKLVLADIDGNRLDAIAEDLRAANCDVSVVAGDLMKTEVIEELIDCTKTAGRLSALVHTAGLSPSMAEARKVLEFNLVATAMIERAFLPLSGAGTAAVFVASTAGHMARFGGRHDEFLRDPLAADLWEKLSGDISSSGDAYIISKRGVIRYVAQVAGEWGARGARINTISPGTIATPMGKLEYENQPLMKAMLEQTPIKRWGEPDDIAACVEFLCSNSASYITGADILIDGGIVAALNNSRAAH